MVNIVLNWSLFMLITFVCVSVSALAVSFFLIPLLKERHQERMIELEKAEEALDQYFVLYDKIESRKLTDNVEYLIQNFTHMIENAEFADFIRQNGNTPEGENKAVSEEIMIKIDRLKADFQDNRELLKDFVELIDMGLAYNSAVSFQLNKISPHAAFSNIDEVFSANKIRDYLSDILQIIFRFLESHKVPVMKTI